MDNGPIGVIDKLTKKRTSCGCLSVKNIHILQNLQNFKLLSHLTIIQSFFYHYYPLS